MARLEFSVEIAAPVKRVRAFFVPQRMPYWYGAEMAAEFEVQGGAADFAAGQKVRITGRVGRHEATLTAMITRCETGRLLEWRFHDAYGVRGLQAWEIEDRGARTQVRMREEYALPSDGWLARAWDALVMRRSVARRDRLHLTKLKTLAERT